MRERSRQLRIIGAAEYVDFPDWGIRGLSARIDTGARTSALHVENVQELPQGRVRFDVRLRRDDPDARVTVEAKVSRRSSVRSSTGDESLRLFVKAYVKLGGVEQRLEVGLVDRGRMLYRMLLGRSALARRFLVDVTKRYALGGRGAAKVAGGRPPRQPASKQGRR